MILTIITVNENLMSTTFDEISLTYKPSCTVEEAALYMMGFPQSYLQPRWLQYSDDPSDGDWFGSEDYQNLAEERESAKIDLAEAKSDKAPEEVIAAKLAELDHCTEQLKLAHSYKTAIINELAKGATSGLHIDNIATLNARNPFITLLSLKRWAQESLNISILAELDNVEPSISETRDTVAEQTLKTTNNKTWNQINLVQTQLTVNKYSISVVDLSALPPDIKPWDIPNPLDPAAEEEWYPAARYLARQYLTDHPGLSITKQKLAVKVAELMTAEKIVHSGNTPYADSTIRKAFRRVTF